MSRPYKFLPPGCLSNAPVEEVRRHYLALINDLIEAAQSLSELVTEAHTLKKALEPVEWPEWKSPSE